MSTVAELLVKIGADSSDLRKEIAATKRQLKSAFGSEGMNLSGKAVTVLEGLGAALSALGVYAVKAGGELQNVQVAMTNMLGSAERAGAFVKELQSFAAHTPFEFNDVTKASQKFLAFGFTAEQIIPTLTAVGDAAAGVGAGQDGVNRLTIALGQIAAKGKLASQEMMQITELGIPAWQLLADKLGTDVATAQDMVTKSMVDSQMALDALVGGMEGRYGGMMEQQSGTILGTWSNLMDGLGQVASQAGLAVFEWMVNAIGSALNAIASVLGNMADSVLPAWASSGLSTISNFVSNAVSWLSGLISKIFETNAALNSVGRENEEDGSKSAVSTPKKEWKMPDFSNFKGSGSGEIPSVGSVDSGGGRGTDSREDNLSDKAASTSKTIEDEWARTFNTKSQLVDRWYKEETAELEKSKSANENYERDKQRLSELYAQKHINSLCEEAKKAQEIQNSIHDASFESLKAGTVFNSDAAAAELMQMQLEHEKTVSGIEERWTKLSNTFIGLNQTEKDVFIAVLKERNIAFTETETGELDFHKQMLKDKLAEDKVYEDTRAEYHAQCKDIQANIDEAYKTNDLARLQEVLTEEAAIRLNDMEAQKTMLDTYKEAFLAAHMTMAQVAAGLYSTALSGLEDAFTSILTNAKSAKEAFADLGKSMIKVIAQYFAKQAAGMIVSHVMGQNLQKKEQAASTAQAAAELAVWAPAAVAYETVHPGSAARALGMVTTSLTTAAAMGASIAAISGISGGAKTSGSNIEVGAYAKGGYFTGPTLGIIGEGADSEVALPLNRAVFNNIAEGIVEAGSSRNSTVTQNIYGDINDAADVDDLFEGLTNMVAAGLRGV